MADQNTEGFNPDKKVGTIPFGTVLDIKVSGFYYARVLQLVTNYAEEHQLDLLKTFEELGKREPANPVEYNFVTLMSLCHAIESAAHDQGVIVEKSFREIMPSQETSPGS